MLSLLLLASLPIVADVDLALELKALKTRVLQGEPTRVILFWSAKRPVQVVPGTESLLLDDGTGYRPFVEADYQEAGTVKPVGTLEPGTVMRTSYVVGVEEIESDPRRLKTAFAFPAPGQYRVKVQYDEVSSNEVTIEVVQPSGTDSEVFNTHLRQRPELLTVWLDLDEGAASLVSGLLTSHGSSPYLARPALVLAARDFAEAAKRDTLAGRNPWEGEALQVFEDLKSRDLSATAFGEDHLLLLAKLSEELFDLPKVREAYQLVVQKFPNGVAALDAEDWLKEHPLDTTPPALVVAAVPSSLWPPNHKVEQITVTLNVTDDTDPSPSVKLVSLTCDDGCNPAADIAGASLDTDDRAFELRSERKGFGSGRTYTITYSAEDAAGNKTTATATVTVAHDQGVAKKK